VSAVDTASEPFRDLAAAVTVAVPTRNERANVPAFLASLPAGVPLVVVDASDDETPELVRALRPDATTVVREKSNIPRARQLAAELARTPWVLFTDADVVFAPEYFERLRALTVPPRTGALYGAKAGGGAYPLYHRVFRAGQALCDACGIPAGSGSNMLVARSALEAAGGFDLELTCNEDSEVLWRVKRAGFAVRFVPELAVDSRDHRRLARGSARKLVHSVARCALLWSGVVPRRVLRRNDWGYWSR